jgi:hypothetical protein
MGISASLMNQLMTNQISGGIVSSICFAAISSIYLLVLRHMRNSGLRGLIPSSDSDVAVVCPGQPAQVGEAKAASMTAEEAMALAEVLQCAAALNKHPSVLSSADKPRHTGIISLGGGMCNSFTAANLSDFCPGLRIQPPCGPDEDTLISHGSTQIKPPTEDQSVAFIIRLSSSMTGCQGPVLLIFGEYGSDTCAAACYLRKNAKQLHRHFRGDSFAVKLVTRPRLGHPGFPGKGSHEDISADVFDNNGLSGKKRLLEWVHGPERNRRPGHPPPPYPLPQSPGASRDRAAATAR